MMTPEAIAAIAAAILTSGGGVIAARVQARRALKASGGDEADFRDDLRADNQDLRRELREVKQERDRIRIRVDGLEIELQRLRRNREERQEQDRDANTRSQELIGDSQSE